MNHRLRSCPERIVAAPSSAYRLFLGLAQTMQHDMQCPSEPHSTRAVEGKTHETTPREERCTTLAVCRRRRSRGAMAEYRTLVRHSLARLRRARTATKR